MAEQLSVTDRLGFNRSFSLGSYSIIHSSIKYLPRLFHVHGHLLTADIEVGKEYSLTLTCPCCNGAATQKVFRDAAITIEAVKIQI